MSEKTFPWRTLLFISVAFNLLITGVAVGAYGAGVRLERQGAPSARLPAPREFMAALPPEARARLRDELVRTWVQSQPLRQQAAQARRDAFDAAATEPFDAARVRAAFARVRQTDEAALAEFHENVIASLAQMAPQERQRAVAALRNARPRRQALAPAGPGVGAPAVQAPTNARGAQQSDAPTLTRRQQFRAGMRERIRERRAQRQGVTP